jgi:hypothetical protein
MFKDHDMPTLEENIRRAKELVDSITDDTPAAEVRRIESEHGALLAEIDTRANRVADAAIERNHLDPADFAHLSGNARRIAVLNTLAERDDDTRIDSNVGLDPHTGGEATTNRVRAMGEALFHRVSPNHAPSGEARQYIGLTIPDMARRVLETAGQRTMGYSTAELVTRALNTTSDFPLILGDSIGRVLRAAYMAAPSGIKQVAMQSTARDFRAKRSLTFSEAPKLEKVLETGEFKRGSFEESQESYSVATYGKIFGISRQALVNDDLSAFTTVPRRLGQAAQAFEAQTLADLLANNPKMADGKAVFHADHKNLAGTAAAISVTSVSAARAAMRDQVGLTGELISVTPKYLIVPNELETAADQLVATITPATVSEANPFAARLQVIVEPRLTDATAWYLAADPAEIDGLEYSYLEGYDGAYIETRNGFDVDGVEIKVRLDFGAGWLDHRGWYKNAGASG